MEITCLGLKIFQWFLLCIDLSTVQSIYRGMDNFCIFTAYTKYIYFEYWNKNRRLMSVNIVCFCVILICLLAFSISILVHHRVIYNVDTYNVTKYIKVEELAWENIFGILTVMDWVYYIFHLTSFLWKNFFGEK